ncbi:hypothetical protein A2313_03005 [Candidatus Roizmanbacteria bacterium RIFOXYB2_FULL_41_10]|nr:MAG: hypothetical protein A2313_03005 [Candidatus Roizmanbacteria bacterium RIFOXYB2_FULL_41_10]
MAPKPKAENQVLVKWKPLFWITGLALYTIIFLVFIQIIVYVVNPPPKDVIGFFNLFQKNIILGLLSLDVIMFIDWILQIPLFLTLYILLKRKNESYMLLATALGLVGIAIYFSSGIAFEMLSLSGQYAIAATEVQKTSLLSAGQMLLATYQGTAFNVSYILVALALLIDSFVMLKSEFFTRITAYIGIAMGILMLIPPTVGTIGLIFSFLSLIPMMVWFVIVGKRLSKLPKIIS